MSVELRTDCLDDVIGLSRSECECFDVPTNESDSGLFLDEIEGLDLVAIASAADCNKGSLWDLMRMSREQSILAFKADLGSQLAMTYKALRKNFKGNIGRDESNNTETISNFAGLRMLFAPVKNGVFIIKRIGLYFNTTGTVDLQLFNNIDAAALQTFSGLNTEANRVKWNNLATPVSLPIYSTEKDYLEYFVLYGNPGFAPKNNKIKCGCGNQVARISFSCNSPVFDQTLTDERFTWNHWANITGVTGTTTDAIIAANAGFNDRAYGILIDGEIKCNMKDIACNDLDFDNSEVALVMAHALRYRAGQLLVDNILASGNINRYTMLDRERLYGQRSRYAKEYTSRIEWLKENMDWQGTGCLTCEPVMTKRSLL